MTCSLEQDLYDKPYAFEFVQTVRLLSWIHSPAIKTDGASVLDTIFFKSRVFVSAPPSDVFRVKIVSKPQRVVVISVNFIGIAGIQGPLPVAYTEILLNRLRRKDKAFRDFLDIFNHRILSLFYKIEEKYHPALQRFSSDQTPIGRCLEALGGGVKPFRAIGAKPFLPYASFFWQKPHNPSALKSMIEDYFSVKASVISLVGRWIPLKKEQCTYLGQDSKPLGQSAMLGSHSWCQNYGIIVRVITPSLSSYLNFLPIGENDSAFFLLKKWLSFYIGPAFGFQIQLAVEKIPDGLQLSSNSEPYLGWTSWLGSVSQGQKEPSLSWITAYTYSPPLAQVKSR